MHQFRLYAGTDTQSLADTIEPATRRRSTVGAPHRSGRNIRKRESAVRQIVECKGIRLKKLGKDRYCLIDQRLDSILYLFDGVSLETVELHFEEAQVKTFGGHSSQLDLL
jgi:hypothetical protein